MMMAGSEWLRDLVDRLMSWQTRQARLGALESATDDCEWVICPREVFQVMRGYHKDLKRLWCHLGTDGDLMKDAEFRGKWKTLEAAIEKAGWLEGMGNTSDLKRSVVLEKADAMTLVDLRRRGQRMIDWVRTNWERLVERGN